MREARERRRLRGAVATVVMAAVVAVVSGCPTGVGNQNGTDAETYTVGATGPAGGIVFYDKGEYSDGWRYLEAAPASTEWTNKPWGGKGTPDGIEVGLGAQGTAIGTGAANTEAIVAEYGDEAPLDDRTDYAAKLAADLDHGGYDDWFLPSKDELDLMYQNLYDEGIGNFTSEEYLTSSERSPGSVWAQNFPNGGQYDYSKDVELKVRAARAF